MNNDVKLIFEAYKKYIIENTQDKNYVPSWKQEEARPKSHAETLYSNPEKLNADVIALVNDHAEESIQNIATLIDREIIKSVEDQGDGFVSQIAHMIMGLIRRDKEIKLDRQERDALNKELQGMYISKRK